MPNLRVKNELPLIPGYSEGAIAYASDAAAAPLNKCICYINPTQSGSGDPSPSNVRPITGHTELNLVHTGANIWDEEYRTDGYFNTSGYWVSANTNLSSKYSILVKPNTVYYVCCPQNVYIHYLKYAVSSGTDQPEAYISRSSALKNTTFTTPANCYAIQFNASGTYGTTYNNDISINYPSTDTSYHAYTGTTTTTDLGTTVYGGTLDVVSGVLTIDRGMIKLSDINWTDTTSNPPVFRGRLSSIPNIQLPPNNAVPTTAITESFGSYAYSPLSASTIGKFAVSDEGSNMIVFIDNSVNTLEAFLQKYGDDILVYPLATPTTIQLTPQEVNSLLGVNNIYHDCNGDMKITFIRRLDS